MCPSCEADVAQRCIDRASEAIAGFMERLSYIRASLENGRVVENFQIYHDPPPIYSTIRGQPRSDALLDEAVKGFEGGIRMLVPEQTQKLP